jgi:Domain of unknown function (DUF4386)
MEEKMKLEISDRKRAVYAGIMILLAYGVLVSAATQAKFLVLIADVMSGLSVIGIAVLMYPLFKGFNERASHLYLGLRLIEGILMIAAGFVFLASPSTREMIYDKIQVWPFILGAFAFYYLLYQSRLVPRFISVWGFVGTAVLAITTGLKMFGQSVAVLEYFLILVVTNEIFLAAWFMAKGFNKSASAFSGHREVLHRAAR